MGPDAWSWKARRCQERKQRALRIYLTHLRVLGTSHSVQNQPRDLSWLGTPLFSSGAKPVTVSRTANAEESGDERGKLLAALDV